MVASNQIATFLEVAASKTTPITYGDVLRKFPEFPPLSGNWKAHPLCSLFGELDEEDGAAARPMRTAIVVTKGNGRPGQGFFDTFDKIYGVTTDKSEQDEVWLSEYGRLVELYADGRER